MSLVPYFVEKVVRPMYKISSMLRLGLLALTIASGTLMTARAEDSSESLRAPAESNANSSELLTEERFPDLVKLIKPQPGESRWRDIPWLLNVSEARKKAAEEGKPILIWSGGGAPPTGGC